MGTKTDGNSKYIDKPLSTAVPVNSREARRRLVRGELSGRALSLSVSSAEAGRVSVKEKLLDAAARLFCEKGFEGTSVRDLTSDARCNIAAVNYYFGGKDKLYTEMFRRQMQEIAQKQIGRIEEILSRPSPTIEEFLREMVAPSLPASYEKRQSGQIMQLMVREVLNKTLRAEELVAEFRRQMLEPVVKALMKLESGLDEKTARLVYMSIDGLVLHPFLFMEYYVMIVDGLKFEEVVEHTVRFAAGATRNIAC